jgi:acetyl/propionyl-CoA carboxylase alpha subunit
VYAEDPAKSFLPSPGTIHALEWPSGEGIRVEAGIAEGAVVSVHYDPLLAKLIARGANREETIGRMLGALARCRIEGVRTTVPFLARAIGSDAFRAGALHTQIVEEGTFNA